MDTDQDGIRLKRAQVDELMDAASHLDTTDLYALAMLLLGEAGKRLIDCREQPRRVAAGAIIATHVLDIHKTIGRWSSL